MTNNANELYNNLEGFLQGIPAGNSFSFTRCLNAKVDKTWDIPCRKIPEHNLILQRGGQCTYKVEDIEYRLKRGNLLWIYPQTQHYAFPDPGNPPSFVVLRVNFRGSKALNASRGKSFLFTPNNFDELEKLFIELAAQFYRERSAQSNLHITQAVMHLITGKLIEDLKHTQDSCIDMRIEKVRMLINSEPWKRQSVKELAKEAGISERYFSKKFKLQTGLTPKSYQLKARIHYARFLLESGECNVGMVADMLGYPDQFVFSKQFSKIYNYSPSQVSGKR